MSQLLIEMETQNVIACYYIYSNYEIHIGKDLESSQLQLQVYL